MRVTLLSLIFAVAFAQAADDRFANVEIETIPVSGPVYMLTGAGGNLAVSIGADGSLLVDDQFEPLAPRIEQAIEQLSGARPRLVLNTHFHADHVGSNAVFGRTGVIVAHENVRLRLLNENAALPALPLVTFSDRLRIHFNEDEIDVIHLPAGHTDGDSVIWFRSSNVVHMGDLFFNGRFPFIDLDSGGTVDGYLANVTRVLEMVPADARVIPGHGPLGGVADLAAFRAMIARTQESVRRRLHEGASLDALIAEGLGPEWAPFAAGFVNEERWIRTLEAGEHPSSSSGNRRRE